MTNSAPVPRLHLLTGPAGSGKTTRALEAIRQAATIPGSRGRGATGPGEALLVVPTYSQALHLQRVALSRWDARAILDDPFATFTSAGERFLPDFRVRALPAAEERDRLMAEAARLAAAPVFEAVRRHVGFRSRLLRLVKEVKQSGRDPAASRARLQASASRLGASGRERLDAFLLVFERYEELLVRAGLEDHEDSLRRLLEHLREAGTAIRAPRVLVVDGFDDFTPVEQAILDALADAVAARGGHVIVALPWDEKRPRLFAASEAARRHLLGRGFAEERLTGFPRSRSPALERIATTVFGAGDEPPTATVAGEDDAVELVVAGDPEDEAEAVAREARRLRRDGTLSRGWRDLGVVVRRLDEAGPRLAAAFERLGVPYRLVGAGAPLAAQGLVRALRGPLALLTGSEGIESSALLTWLRWRALADAEAAATRAVDALEMRWRRSGFPVDAPALQAALPADARVLLEAHGPALASARGAAEVRDALRAALLDLVPLPAAGALDAAGRPLDPDADRHRLHAAAARDRVLGLIDGLASAAARTGLGADDDVRAVTILLDDAIEQARLVLPDRRLDAVSILDAEEARFWELPVVFVAGLAQGAFPLHPVEDVLLRDDERETLRTADAGLALPLARERETRERRLFYGALTRARRRLVLFRPGSTGDGDARAPSLFLRDLERVVETTPRTPRSTGRAAPRLAECFTASDLALFAAATANDPGADAEEAELSRALLARGDPTLSRRAARWRRNAADELGDGVELARFERSVALVSATTLGAAAACRYRHFLRAVVGVPEDDALLEGPAFGARDEGTLLHRALRQAVETPDRTVAEVVADVLAWVAGPGRREVAPVDEVEHDRLERELNRVVALFRDRERETGGPLHPLAGGLERAFGTGAEPPVELGEGAGVFALRGTIDRVDVAGPNAVIIDYKRSHGSVDRAAKACAEGIDLQLPLYAAAMEKLIDREVVGLEWVAATRRRRRGRWSESAGALYESRREGVAPKAVPPDEWRAFLADAIERSSAVVADVRAGGHTLQTEDAKRCGHCAFFTVCRTSFVRGRVPEATEEAQG